MKFSADDVVPYLNITTHLEDTPDQDVFGALGGSGFPTLFFIEPETGAVLNDWFPLTGEKAVRDMLAKTTASADSLRELMKAVEADKDNKGLQAALTLKLVMLKAKEMSLEEMEALAKTEGIPADILEEFGEYRGAKQVENALKELRPPKVQSREEFEEMAPKVMYDLFKGGTRIATDHELAMTFFPMATEGAIAAADKANAEKAYALCEKTLKAFAEARPSAADAIDEQLADMRKRIKALG